MNIPTTLLPTSFEAPAAPKTGEPTIPETDDFSSLMASIWCGPAPVMTKPTEIPTTTEPKESPIPVGAEPTITPELPPMTRAIDPILIKSKETDITFTEQIDLSSPGQVAEVVPPEVKSDVDAIETFPILTFEDKGPEVTKEQSTPGFTRLPIDLETPPVEPKVVSPIHRTPAIGASIELPAKETIDNKVVADEVSVEEAANPKVLPQDQLTAEAIKREANLAAGYLAQSTRESREGGLQAIKAQVAEIRPDSPKVEAVGELKEQSSTNHAPFSLSASSAEMNTKRVGSSDVVAQLERPILETVNTIPPKQTRSLRIRLKPEELGQVEVQLSRDAAGKVSAQMYVERENARQVLSQTLPQLRQALEQAGIAVDHLQVSSESSSFAGNARNQDQPAEGNSRASFVSSNQENTPRVDAPAQVRDHKLLSLNA